MSEQKNKAADRAAIVERLIQKFGNQGENDTKISVGDFLRLLAVAKEIDTEEGIGEVRVKWVENETAER